MATYKVEDIVKRVKVVIDQNVNDQAMTDFGDVDTLALDEIIKGVIAPAVRMLEMAAPTLMLGGGVDFKPKEGEGSIISYEGKKYSFHVKLPNDFMRLVALKMSDWTAEVHDVTTADDAMYKVLRNAYGCVRADVDNPIVVVVNGGGNNYAIEAYGSEGNDATLEIARYVPEPKVMTDGGIEICEPLYDAAVYEAASLAMQTIENVNLANSLHGMALSLAKIETKG